MYLDHVFEDYSNPWHLLDFLPETPEDRQDNLDRVIILRCNRNLTNKFINFHVADGKTLADRTRIHQIQVLELKSYCSNAYLGSTKEWMRIWDTSLN